MHQMNYIPFFSINFMEYNYHGLMSGNIKIATSLSKLSSVPDKFSVPAFLHCMDKKSVY